MGNPNLNTNKFRKSLSIGIIVIQFFAIACFGKSEVIDCESFLDIQIKLPAAQKSILRNDKKLIQENATSQHENAWSLLLKFDEEVLKNSILSALELDKSNSEIPSSSDIDPPFSNPEALGKMQHLLKINPEIQDAIGRLDFSKINLKSAIKSHPALFQVLMQQVLESNYSIEIVSKFIDAMPIQWLRKLIGRSFLLDESKNATIRSLSKKLKELGEYDEYTREHSIMVGLWALKLYSQVARSSENLIKKLSKFEFVGHSIKKTMLYSEETFKSLSNN